MRRLVVHLVTSPRRGAGTTASVRIDKVVTSDGRAYGPFPWLRNGFPTGSTVTTHLALENIEPTTEDSRALKIMRAASAFPSVLESPTKPGVDVHSLGLTSDGVANAGPGWLLEGARVSNPDTNETWWLPCGRWLGESDAGDGESGPLSTVLYLPGQEPDDTYKPVEDAPSEVPVYAATVSAAATPDVNKLRNGTRAVIKSLNGTAGEDAYFVSKDHRRFGVADGVSEWSEIGVDAGEFARALLRGADRAPATAIGIEWMRLAHAEALTSKVKGSATIVLMSLSTDGKQLNVVSLGDSKVVLVRKGRVAKRTIEQELEFGSPLQLTSEANPTSSPANALVDTWNVRPGDIAVLGTDGLFDNVDENVIARIASAPNIASRFLASTLVAEAYRVSLSQKEDTPFSRQMTEYYDKIYQGGKADDITVVVVTFAAVPTAPG